MPDKIVVLSDRIKELSETTGTTNMHLQGAATGFSPFSDFYSNSDLVYYAITDGQYYEVGSGQFLLKAGDDELIRFPFKSSGPGATLDTDKVSWPIGVKEIYVTYPAPQSVYTAFGLSPDYNKPKESGFAFWSSANILNYDSNLVWNSGQGRMGIGVTPDHALHIGGNTAYSLVKASGFIASESGLFFPEGNGGTATYSGGRQLEHFVRNKLDDTAVSEGKLGGSTGSSSVIELSGVVDQYILLKQQIKGSVFAGPPSGCGVSCSPAYPNFRYLTLDDLPDLSSLYVTRTGTTSAGNVAFWQEDNVLTDDDYLTWDDASNKLGVGNNDPQYQIHVGGTAGITGDTHIGGDTIASGHMFIGGNLDVAGNTSYIDSNVVTIWDQHLELASMSGAAIVGDTVIDGVGGAGVIIKSTDGDKSILWRSSCDAWQVKGKDGYNLIDVSGIIFNGDCDHLISGAYKAGSGLSLHGGLEFNVGDMFSLGASPPQTIHQGDTILVSGVSGVATTMSKVGNNHILWVDPTELSGILSGGSTASLTEVSGILDNYIDFVSGEFVSGSGALNNKFGDYTLLTDFTSGSGALDNDITSVSGMFVSGSGALNSKIDNLNIDHEIKVSEESGDNLETVSGIHFPAGSIVSAHGGKVAVVDFTAGTAGTLAALSDVTLTSSTNKDHLQFNGAAWVNVTSPSGALNSQFVSGSGALDNYIDFVSGELNSASGSLQNATDTNSSNWISGSGALNSQFVSGSGALDNYIDFVSGELNSASGSLQNAIDLSATSLKVTENDGSPELLSVSGLQFTNASVTSAHAGKIAVIDLTAGAAGDLAGLTDVTLAGLANGHHLQYNGANWENAVTASGALNNQFVSGSGALNSQFVSGSGALNNQFVSGSGALDNYIDFVSGEFVSSSGALNNKIDNLPGATAITADSGVIRVGDELRLDPRLLSSGVTGSTTNLIALGTHDAGSWNNPHFSLGDGSHTILIGNTAGKDAQVTNPGNEFLAIGPQAGELYGATSYVGVPSSSLEKMQDGSICIGFRAGWKHYLSKQLEAGKPDFIAGYNTLIGSSAGSTSYNMYSTVAIGNSAGEGQGATAAYGSQFGVHIGTFAGQNLSSGNYCVDIGALAGYSTKMNSYVHTMGRHAGSQSFHNRHVNMFGTDAGNDARELTCSNLMGSGAGYYASGCDHINLIGTFTGSGAKDCSHSNIIGNEAGYLATGCTNINMLGYRAGYNTESNSKSNLIGFQAGEWSNDVTYSEAIGMNAGRFASGVTNSVFLGISAGLATAELVNNTSIGHAAGAYANGDEWTTNIGFSAGWEGSGSTNGISIGDYAGRTSTKSLQRVALGYKTQEYASGVRSFIAIGANAGSAASGWKEVARTNPYIPGHATNNTSLHQYSIAIGQNAAQRTENTNQLIAMGRRAGAWTHDSEHVIAMGYRAGIQRKENDTSIYIGRDAGAYSEGDGSTPIVAGGNHQLFIGHKAGRFNTGDQNMSILANGSTAGDAINAGSLASPKVHNNRLNIANLIYGHTGSTAGLNRKLMIGHIAGWNGSSFDAPHDHLATLHVVPADAGHTEVCLHLAAAHNGAPATDRLNSTGYTGHGSTLSLPSAASNARMTTRTSRQDTNYTSSSNQYTQDMNTSWGSAANDGAYGYFFNVDAEGNMATIGQRGFPIVPSFKRTMTDGGNPWANSNQGDPGYLMNSSSRGEGHAINRQSCLRWFNKKYDPYDYEVGTMIFAQFHHGPTEAMWPYLMILGTDNGSSGNRKWRYIPMPSYDIVEGNGWDNCGLNQPLNRFFYGLPMGYGTYTNPTLTSSNNVAKATVRRRWTGGTPHLGLL